MQRPFSLQQPTPEPARLAALRVGDQVCIWDKGQSVWRTVAALKTTNGRLKIRVTDADFYFDEALVTGYAVNLLGADGQPAPRELETILNHVERALHDARLRTLLALCRISDRNFDLNALTCARRNFTSLRGILDRALVALQERGVQA